jgi:NAD(P)-dependent dehydrogenase (short-subunit alcohol dehydrogenase family)
MRIDGNTFLVAGGASGLGEGTARALMERGGRVVIGDIDATRGRALAKDLGDAARFIEMNVADEGAGRAAVALARSTFGGLHGMVNVAGVVHGEKILGKTGTHSIANLRRMLEVNVVGAFNMVCAAAEAMASSPPSEDGERGVIVNTASVAAFDGQIGQAAYSAAKGGVAAMTLPLARELAANGIRVVTIAPGIFDTPLLASTLAKFLPPAPPTFTQTWTAPTTPTVPQSIKDEVGRMIPFPPRLGRPDEFASLALHIIENRLLNGAVIRLDGAIRMQAV